MSTSPSQLAQATAVKCSAMGVAAAAECIQQALDTGVAVAVKPLVWTKERPTAPGHYWLRIGDHPEAGLPVYVWSSLRGLTWERDGHKGLVNDTAGWWAGPLPPPLEPTAAAL